MDLLGASGLPDGAAADVHKTLVLVSTVWTHKSGITNTKSGLSVGIKRFIAVNTSIESWKKSKFPKRYQFKT